MKKTMDGLRLWMNACVSSSPNSDGSVILPLPPADLNRNHRTTELAQGFRRLRLPHARTSVAHRQPSRTDRSMARKLTSFDRSGRPYKPVPLSRDASCGHKE